MKIRSMGEGDLNRIAELERLVNPLPWKESALKAFAHPTEALPRHLGWVVEPTGSDPVAGYVCAVVNGTEAEILIVGVEPGRRRQGFGKNLIQICCQELKAQNVGRVFLELRAGNAAARALYESLEFRAKGLRKGYYADSREDAVQMRRDL